MTAGRATAPTLALREQENLPPLSKDDARKYDQCMCLSRCEMDAVHFAVSQALVRR